MGLKNTVGKITLYLSHDWGYRRALVKMEINLFT
jgi:hypothetical protein